MKGLEMLACGVIALLIVAVAFAAWRGLWKIAAKMGLIGAMAVGCMAASGGCGSELHKATVTAGTIAASLNTAAQVNHTNTFEDDGERKLIATHIRNVAVANNTFIGALKSAESNGGKLSQAAILLALQELSTQVDSLNSEGILKLKSQQARNAYSLAITAVKASLAALQVQAGRDSARLRNGAGAVSAAGVVFSSAEITELIELGVAAGSTLVPKLFAMKDETDAQILAQAQADDEEAIKLAEEDGADLPTGESEPGGESVVGTEPEAEDKQKAS